MNENVVPGDVLGLLSNGGKSVLEIDDVRSVIFGLLKTGNDIGINIENNNNTRSYLSISFPFDYNLYHLKINKYCRIGVSNIINADVFSAFENIECILYGSEISNILVSDLDFSLLSLAEKNEIKYWNPSCYGDILFNWWD